MSGVDTLFISKNFTVRLLKQKGSSFQKCKDKLHSFMNFLSKLLTIIIRKVR